MFKWCSCFVMAMFISVELFAKIEPTGVLDNIEPGIRSFVIKAGKKDFQNPTAVPLEPILTMGYDYSKTPFVKEKYRSIAEGYRGYLGGNDTTAVFRLNFPRGWEPFVEADRVIKQLRFVLSESPIDGSVERAALFIDLGFFQGTEFSSTNCPGGSVTWTDKAGHEYYRLILKGGDKNNLETLRAMNKCRIGSLSDNDRSALQNLVVGIAPLLDDLSCQESSTPWLPLLVSRLSGDPIKDCPSFEQIQMPQNIVAALEFRASRAKARDIAQQKAQKKTQKQEQSRELSETIALQLAALKMQEQEGAAQKKARLTNLLSPDYFDNEGVFVIKPQPSVVSIRKPTKKPRRFFDPDLFAGEVDVTIQTSEKSIRLARLIRIQNSDTNKTEVLRISIDDKGLRTIGPLLNVHPKLQATCENVKQWLDFVIRSSDLQTMQKQRCRDEFFSENEDIEARNLYKALKSAIPELYGHLATTEYANQK